MDATLVSIVKDTHCSSWMHRAELFRRTSGVHKTAKQLRERFTEHINPDRNYDAFDEDESAQLVRLFRKFGPMWSHLASLLRGRTAGRVKNEMMKQISRISRIDAKEAVALQTLLVRRTRKRQSSLTFEGFDEFDTVNATCHHDEETMASPAPETACSTFELNTTGRVNGPDAPAIPGCDESMEIDWLEELRDLMNDTDARFPGQRATQSGDDDERPAATWELGHPASPAQTTRTDAKRAAGLRFSVFSVSRGEILRERLKPPLVLAHTFTTLLGGGASLVEN